MHKNIFQTDSQHSASWRDLSHRRVTVTPFSRLRWVLLQVNGSVHRGFSIIHDKRTNPCNIHCGRAATCWYNRHKRAQTSKIHGAVVILQRLLKVKQWSSLSDSGLQHLFTTGARWWRREGAAVNTHRKQCVTFYPAELGRAFELIWPQDTANYADTSCWISLSLVNRDWGGATAERDRKSNTLKCTYCITYRPCMLMILISPLMKQRHIVRMQ